MRFFHDWKLERDGEEINVLLNLSWNREFEEIEILCAHEHQTGMKIILTGAEERAIEPHLADWLEQARFLDEHARATAGKD